MFSWFDLCWQEIPKTSQIPKTFANISGHQGKWDWARCSLYSGAGIIPLHPVQFHKACAGGAVCLWISEPFNPIILLIKYDKKNHRKFLALYTFSYPLLKQLRSGNPTVWETQALLLGFCLDLPRSFKDQEVGLAAHEPARLCLGSCGWVQQVGPKGLHGAIKFCFVSLIYYVILLHVINII